MLALPNKSGGGSSSILVLVLGLLLLLQQEKRIFVHCFDDSQQLHRVLDHPEDPHRKPYPAGHFEREYRELYNDTDDKDALESIRALHEQLDDDNDGTIEPSETGDFIKADLQYRNGDRNLRQTNFHKKDAEITVKDLWQKWRRSEVYNWTTSQVVDWLVHNVDLPQYAENFRHFAVNGTHLPKVAVSTSFLSKVVGVQSPIHRSKITLKAMDVVLFGPPRDQTNWMKDAILTSLLVIAVSGLFYAYRQNKKSREHLKKMMLDMDSLANAERTLQELQEKLQQKDSKIESLSSTPTDLPEALEVSRLREEVEVLRSELHRAEVELEDKCWMAPPVLQNWLQLTYELESLTYNAKKKTAEEQLEMAKDMCEKLKRKRSSLVGAFVSTHGRSIDDVDRSILEARTALLEVTKDLTERSQRWRQIEILCGCTIINNPGLQALQSLVRHVGQGRAFPHPSRNLPSSRMSTSVSQEEDLHATDDFDAHSVAASHLTAASSHVSRPGSYLSASVVHHTIPTIPSSGHLRRRNEFRSSGRESSKESSSSSDEVEPGKAALLQAPQALGRPATPPVVTRSSAAALKRSKMMQKSFSQDASGSIGQHTSSSSNGGCPSSGMVASRKMSSSVSEGQLQEKMTASNPSPVLTLKSSLSSSSSSSGLHHLVKPSIMEELEESCSASESGSITDLDAKGKKKKRSFFNFKRKKEKKVEI